MDSNSPSSCESSKQSDQKTCKPINHLTSHPTVQESELNNDDITVQANWSTDDSIQSCCTIPISTSNSINSSRIATPNSVTTINPTPNLSSSVTVILDDYISQTQLQPLSTNREHVTFIQNYIHNDENCIFDEYISQINGENDSALNIKKTHITKPNLRVKLKKHKLRFNLNIPQTALLCSNGLSNGVHEWTFKILECDNNRQEIGVVSISDIENIKMHTKGIRYTQCFGARAVYGSSANVAGVHSYYASYNTDSTERCYKDLGGNDKILWSPGDVIRVCMNLYQFRIKFYVNDVKIRKTLSLETGHTYYPIVMFYGNCKYELINFK